MDPIKLMWIGAITFWSALAICAINLVVTFLRTRNHRTAWITDSKFMETFRLGFAIHLVSVILSSLGACTLISGFIWFVVDRLSKQ